uniref:Uncharacterized protein n=1 Tax=Setaria italica TaxID=4555 RepID=K3YF75_SETIT
MEHHRPILWWVVTYRAPNIRFTSKTTRHIQSYPTPFPMPVTTP